MLPLDSKGYGTHAGRRQLGLDGPRKRYARQACGGDVTTECYLICLRKCYPPDHQPPAPFISGAPCAEPGCDGEPYIYARGGKPWCQDHAPGRDE